MESGTPLPLHSAAAPCVRCVGEPKGPRPGRAQRPRSARTRGRRERGPVPLVNTVYTFISDYMFLNIIKSLACSGGSVSQSGWGGVGDVGGAGRWSYFSRKSPENERGAGQRETNKGPFRRRREERRRADTRGNALSRTQSKVPETRGPAMRGGRHRRSN